MNKINTSLIENLRLLKSLILALGVVTAIVSCTQPKPEIKTQSNTETAKVVQTPPIIKAELAHLAQAIVGEGALWNYETQTFWWIDIEGKTLNIFDPKTKENIEYETPSRIGTVVPSESGTAIIAVEEGIMELDLQTKKTTLINPVDSDIKETRLNDGKCDPAGRLYVGSMDRKTTDPYGSLYRIDQGKATQLLDSITISNGIVWTKDKKTMYYIDTPTGKVMAYDYEISTGDITNPRVAINVPKSVGSPDGMAIDENDNLWVGMWNGNAIIHYDPLTGKKLAQIDVPAHNVTTCAFGGSDLDTLYITTARVDMSDAELDEKPLSGSVFKCVPGVRGVKSDFYQM